LCYCPFKRYVCDLFSNGVRNLTTVSPLWLMVCPKTTKDRGLPVLLDGLRKVAVAETKKTHPKRRKAYHPRQDNPPGMALVGDPSADTRIRGGGTSTVA
jgi:hypothetical protein